MSEQLEVAKSSYEMTVKQAIRIAKQEYVITTLSPSNIMNLRKDIVKILIQEAERVDELEDINDILSHSIDDVSGASGYMIKKLKQQNKRYREALGKICSSEIDDADEFSDFAEQTAWQALENDENS